VLVAVVFQLGQGLLVRAWPDFHHHITTRLSNTTGGAVVAAIAVLVVSTLAEELVFRATFQQRFSAVMRPLLAVLVVSLAFGLVHRSPGSPAVAAADMALVALDGVVYGWIFALRRNLLVGWLAHFLADTIGLLLLLRLT
jgi:membrane protease YdiL (CAAX protease family)